MDRPLNFEIPRWPSEFPANLCRPVCLGELTGRHWLAGNSEGHRGNSKFLFLMVTYSYFESLASGIKEVAFFYHLKYQSCMVNSDLFFISWFHTTIMKLWPLELERSHFSII